MIGSFRINSALYIVVMAMRLGMIYENVQSNIWYHVAMSDHLESIQKRGLSKGTVGNNPEKSGKGVYFFQPPALETSIDKLLDIASDMVYFLGFDEGILVSADLSGHKLLMDEDALIIWDVEDIPRLNMIMPPEAVRLYAKFLHGRGGSDELPINDQSVAKFKVNLIDKYQIEAHADWKVEVFRRDMLTCRVAQPVTTIIDIKNVSDTAI